MKKIIITCLIISVTFVLQTPTTYAITQASEPLYNGIDVSDWQGYIDYAQVKNSGIDIVYIKASQGSTIIDSYFEYNYNNAKANGLKVGFYHYLTATTIRRSGDRSTIFCTCDFRKKSRLQISYGL